MNPLVRIMGIGGAAISGVLVAATAVRSIPESIAGLIVLLATVVSAVLGGLAPVVGLYVGIGAVLGFLLSALFGFRAETAWPTMIFLGLIVGCTHLLLLTRKRRAILRIPSGTPEPCVSEVEYNGSIGKLGRLSLVFAIVVGAFLLFLFAGPPGIVSPFVSVCVALGLIAGYALFLGFAVSSIFHKTCRQRDGKHLGDGPGTSN
ncbi:MAG: hypothetical protein ABFC54_08065 [Thermoguttaceae bacterium]